jgi:hypothetical protein
MARSHCPVLSPDCSESGGIVLRHALMRVLAGLHTGLPRSQSRQDDLLECARHEL